MSRLVRQHQCQLADRVNLSGKNVGRLDRMLRLLIDLSRIPVGLFALRGAAGSLAGIEVVFAVIPILTGLTRCRPVYLPFGVSTVSDDRGIGSRTDLSGLVDR